MGQVSSFSCSNPQRSETKNGSEPEQIPYREGIVRELEEDDGKYQLGDAVGSGASCQVHIATEANSQREYAIKVMENVPDFVPPFEHEVKILGALYHPNVIDFVDAYKTPTTLNIVTPFMRGKELFDRVANGAFSERIAAQRTKDMLLAVAHCHSRSVIHRDLKPENFVFETESEESKMRLLDFGCALIREDDETVDTVCGSPYYIAPDLLVRNPPQPRTGKTWKAADMWSIGVIVYMFVHGYPPFAGSDTKTITRRIQRGKYRFGAHAHLSQGVKDFISKLLIRDPSKRMTAEEALLHPWIAELDDHSDEPFPEEVKASLKDFTHSNKLKRAVGRLLAKRMNKHDEQLLKDAFSHV